MRTQGSYGVHEDVDIRVEGNGAQKFNGAVGFKKKADGTYTAVGDFYGLRTENGQRVTESMMKAEVTASAKEAEIMERLASMEFQTAQHQETDGEITMSFQRWVD